jgi:hypothetical protein
MSRSRAAHLLLPAALLVLAACGYRPAGSLSAQSTPRIHVAAFANNTFRPGIHALVGAAVLRRLHLDRRLDVVEEPRAEVVLGGEVRGYENEAVAYEEAEIGRRFRIRLWVSATLRDRRGGSPVRHEVLGEAFYTVGRGVTGTRAAEEDGIHRAANDAADRLVSILIDEL